MPEPTNLSTIYIETLKDKKAKSINYSLDRIIKMLKLLPVLHYISATCFEIKEIIEREGAKGKGKSVISIIDFKWKFDASLIWGKY